MAHTASCEFDQAHGYDCTCGVIRVIPVEPIGAREVTGFVCRENGQGGYGSITLPAYPPSPDGERLRQKRNELDLGLREAAKRLRIKASELSDLENGRAVTDDWLKALSELERP